MDKKEAQLLVDRYYKVELLRKSDISVKNPISRIGQPKKSFGRVMRILI